jgi:hypothetical protein
VPRLATPASWGRAAPAQVFDTTMAASTSKYDAHTRKYMVGDPHPDFPLLYVARLNEDGTCGGWGTKGFYCHIDDPHLVIYGRAIDLRLKPRLSRTDATARKLGTLDHPKADTDTPSTR